jgi:hypothetical protein
MAANALQEFLASERRAEEAARLEHERQQKEKSPSSEESWTRT